MVYMLCSKIILVPYTVSHGSRFVHSMVVNCSVRIQKPRASRRAAIMHAAKSARLQCGLIIYRYALKTQPNTNRCRHRLCARTRELLVVDDDAQAMHYND